MNRYLAKIRKHFNKKILTALFIIFLNWLVGNFQFKSGYRTAKDTKSVNNGLFCITNQKLQKAIYNEKSINFYRISGKAGFIG